MYLLFTLALLLDVQVEKTPPNPAWDDYLAYPHALIWSDTRSEQIKEQAGRIGQDLKTYAEAWQKRIDASAQSQGKNNLDGSRPMYADPQYLNLAIAWYLLFLEDQEAEQLTKAMQAINHFNAKNQIPKFAFWYYSIHAEMAIFQRNSPALIRNLFAYWNQVVVKLESDMSQLGLEVTPNHGMLQVLPDCYKITAHFINEGLKDPDLCDTRPLTSLIFFLDERLGKAYWATVDKDPDQQLIRNMVENFNYEFNDVYNPSFQIKTDQFKEAKDALAQWTRKTPLEGDHLRNFNRAMNHLDQAMACAGTERGQMGIMVRRLELISYAASRLVTVPDHGSLLGDYRSTYLQQAYEAFSRNANSNYIQLGYNSEDEYRTVMNQLWHDIQNSSYWIATYFMEHEESVAYDKQFLFAAHPILKDYTNFFTSTMKAVHNGTIDINLIPADTFFRTAETISRYSELLYRLGQLKTEPDLYHQSIYWHFYAYRLNPFNNNYLNNLLDKLSDSGEMHYLGEYLRPFAEEIRVSKSFDNTNQDQPELWKALRDLPPFIDDILKNLGEDLAQWPEMPVEEDILYAEEDHPFHTMLKDFYFEGLKGQN